MNAQGTISSTDVDGIEAVALRCIEIMEHGTYEDFEALIHPEMVNHEAKDEPPEARAPYGPDAAWATARWLRDAFAELRWDVHEVVTERDLVVLHCTMSGRHVNPFADYDEQGEIRTVFPPTGKRFATTQSHWVRIRDGKMVEHWANRDDLGTAMQLGWVPPSPVYLFKAARLKRRMRRARRS
jgi:predicted ester cyclase